MTLDMCPMTGHQRARAAAESGVRESYRDGRGRERCGPGETGDGHGLRWLEAGQPRALARRVTVDAYEALNGFPIGVG